jgi:hypothetical protein
MEIFFKNNNNLVNIYVDFSLSEKLGRLVRLTFLFSNEQDTIFLHIKSTLTLTTKIRGLVGIPSHLTVPNGSLRRITSSKRGLERYSI